MWRQRYLNFLFSEESPKSSHAVTTASGSGLGARRCIQLRWSLQRSNRRSQCQTTPTRSRTRGYLLGSLSTDFYAGSSLLRTGAALCLSFDALHSSHISVAKYPSSIAGGLIESLAFSRCALKEPIRTKSSARGSGLRASLRDW